MGPKSRGTVYDAKKDYVDRSKIDETEFAEFEIYSKSPVTVILLLGSDENEIILRSLHHLDKFAKKLPENIQKLYDFKLVENIFKKKLHEHENLLIRRFSLKLVAEVYHNTDAKFDDDLTKEIVDLARRNYLEDEDNFIVEYSSITLLKLIDEPRLMAALEEDISFVSNGCYKHLTETADPDILYNSYKLLSRILIEGATLENVCAVETFPFERVLSDVNNQFPEIRKAALSVLAELALCKNEFFVSRFCCKPFFDEWFKVVENPIMKDAHLEAIVLCRRLLRQPQIAKLFYMQYLVQYNIFWTNSDLTQEGTHVYYELSMYPDAWEYIYSTGVVSQLRDRLVDTDAVTYELCVTIVKLMNHPQSFMTLMQPDTVANLLSILKNSAKDWKTRGASAEALTMLCKRSLDACQIAVSHNISTVLCDFLNAKYGDIPSDTFINILNLLNSLAKNEEIQSEVMTEDLAQSLLSAIKNSARSAVLVTNLFNTASVFSSNTVLRNQVQQIGFWDTILKYLKSPAVLVKNAVADFVMMTGKSRDFSDPYIDEGVLEVLLADDSSLIACSNWSGAIESILSADLSVKFSVRGRLDLNDVTHRNFFISKHHWKDVGAFRSMIKEEVSPRHTLILVNFDHRLCSEADVVHVPKVCADGVSLLSEEDCTYCRRPSDPYLPKYLDKAQLLLESQGLCCNQNKSYLQNVIDIAKISSRARILAQIVSEEMCGARSGQQTQVCTEPAILNHLNYLKCMLHCNIIPLGQVRYGGHFERAVLFKSLADRTGLPCTLQRGEDGKTLWNEIPVPATEAGEFCTSSSVLPTRLLRPTHIVDLIDHPGELYPINSRKAYEYLRLN